MFKVTLLDGNGTGAFGFDSLQREYNAIKEDIQLNHLINRFKDGEETISNLKEVTTFDPTPNSQLFQSDYYFTKIVKNNLIILTFPTGKIMNKWQLSQLDFYKRLFRTHKRVYKKTSNIIVLCCDYDKEVVLDNLAAIHPELYSYINTIWINNEKNPLVDYLTQLGAVNRKTFSFECPQFIVQEPVRAIAKDWLPVEQKVMSQLYFTGRNLEWKGYKTISILANRLKKYQCFVNVDFNGFVVEKDEALNGPLFDAPLTQFREEIENTNRYYKAFDRKTNETLLKQTGFAVYFTELAPEVGFFPEYALIDAVRNGAVTIVPASYAEQPNILGGRLTEDSYLETGFLLWDPTDEQSTSKLADRIRFLQKKENREIYNSMRENALSTMMEYHNHRKLLKYLVK